MDSTTTRHLIKLNRQFYADFGARFSATRQRIQPGVRKIVSNLLGTGTRFRADIESVLDLGCGNGELARALAQSRFHGRFIGLDFSLPLLADARSKLDGLSVAFHEVDLSAPDWERSLGAAHFSLITAFAVLHHIPGVNLRREILQKVHNLLEPGGFFINSNWQFLNSEKLKNRIQPWESAGLSATDMDENDYLLDWREGGLGLRYVHHFSTQELSQLAVETGFKVKESFLSDGENGRLGLYQIWERYENKR